jgi:hypothetical protein
MIAWFMGGRTLRSESGKKLRGGSDSNSRAASRRCLRVCSGHMGDSSLRPAHNAGDAIESTWPEGGDAGPSPDGPATRHHGIVLAATAAGTFL